ncbi:MAG: QsdR family transcriptional regulator [Gordonia sp. (in: high G+C Gram-positive bacteria)]
MPSRTSSPPPAPRELVGAETCDVVDPIVAQARRTFIGGGKIEMGELAGQVGVNRATLFRRYGGRDQFLAEVIWSVTEPTLRIAARDATGCGGARIAETLGRFAAMANRGFFSDFLRREPERALRIMTTRAFGVHSRVVAGVEDLVRTEVDAGALHPPLPVHDLAFLLVRITESFIYTNTISGEAPDAIKVWQACAVLLGADIPAADDAAAVLAGAKEWK